MFNVVFVVTAAVIAAWLFAAIIVSRRHDACSVTKTHWYHFLSLPCLKGTVGELYVNHRLSFLQSTQSARVLYDVIIPNRRRTAQIDHIVISHSGVFVIETKTYSNNIYGRAKDDYWRQIWAGRKYLFYNPINQNYGHIRALSRLFKSHNIYGLPSNIFHNIIAFPHASRVHVYTSYAQIVSFDEIDSAISRYSRRVLSDAQVSMLASVILKSALTSPDALSSHISNLHSSHSV